MNRNVSRQLGPPAWLVVALLLGFASTGLIGFGLAGAKASAATRGERAHSCVLGGNLRAALRREEIRLSRAARRRPRSERWKLRNRRHHLSELHRKSSACLSATSPSPTQAPGAAESAPAAAISAAPSLAGTTFEEEEQVTLAPGENETVSQPKGAPESLSIAVEGNRLVDGAGQTVLLHGVNLSGTMWECLYGKAFASPTDLASLEKMVAWHINAVRIPMNEDCWLGINGAPTDIEAYHYELKEFIERLHSLGMYAILDLHWSAPGSTLSHLGVGFAGQFEMADADHAPAFWESVSSYFKEDPAVLFDLYNEPFEISWSCWLSGCLAPRGYETAGMQELVDAVRRTGATQPVLVGGLRWASLAGNEWLEHEPYDPTGQLAASIHAYGVLGNFAKNIGVVEEQVPVIMTEIGEMDCADTSLEKLLPWADAHGVSYLAWAWYTGDCARGPSLISDYDGTPTPYGIGFREHLIDSFPPPSPYPVKASLQVKSAS